MKMNKEWTSERIAKEFAAQTAQVRSTRFTKPVVAVEEVAVEKKTPFIKRAAMYVALVAGLSTGAVIAVDAAMPDYDGSVKATICWDCNHGDNVYKTPKAAIKAVNPNATNKAIAKAEKEFKYLNNLPLDLDYSYYLKAGEYEIPVIEN